MQLIFQEIEVQVNIAESKNEPIMVSPNLTREELLQQAADCIRLMQHQENPSQLQLKL